jgi:predicted ATPase
VSHSYSLDLALIFAAILYQHRREALATHEQAESAMILATEQGFVLCLAWGTVLHGWARAMQGQGETGIAEMRQGVATGLATGAKVMQPYFLDLLAEAYGDGGHLEAGLNALDEALAVVDDTKARSFEADLHRLKGELLLKQSSDHTAEAETRFQQALGIARHQHAKALELRASTSLAHLLQSQGKRQEAYDLLAPVYNWFTEGFDTADLQDAGALLDALS